MEDKCEPIYDSAFSPSERNRVGCGDKLDKILADGTEVYDSRGRSVGWVQGYGISQIQPSSSGSRYSSSDDDSSYTSNGGNGIGLLIILGIIILGIINFSNITAYFASLFATTQPSSSQSNNLTSSSPNARNPEAAVVIADEGLRLRTHASMNADKITTLAFGTIILPLERTADGAWIRVRVSSNGVEGWVSAEYIRTEMNLFVLPIRELAATISSSPTNENSLAKPQVQQTLLKYPSKSNFQAQLPLPTLVISLLIVIILQSQTLSKLIALLNQQSSSEVIVQSYIGELQK